MSALGYIRKAAFSTRANAQKISFKFFCDNCPLFYTQMDATYCFNCPVILREQQKKENDNIIHREAMENWKKEKRKKLEFSKQK